VDLILGILSSLLIKEAKKAVSNRLVRLENTDNGGMLHISYSSPSGNISYPINLPY